MKAKSAAVSEPLDPELDRRLLDPNFEYPDIFEEDIDDEQEDIRRDEAAEADYAAGRYATNEEVVEWLKTWGKGEPTPPPRPWLKRD